jgi:hypothetical protein
MQHMRAVLAGIAVVALAGSACPGDYMGAAVTVVDIASSDVPGPQPIRVFPIPAAAGWSGVLVYNNWVENPIFSPANGVSNYQYYDLPRVNADITINGITNPTSPPSVDNTYQLYTNLEGDDGDPLADNRFPYHVPRLARAHNVNYTAVEFRLTTPVPKMGVFLPASSNTWGDDPDYFFPHNFQLQDRSIWVYVQGVGDDFTTAEKLRVSLKGDGDGMYCPFMTVDWNGTDLIKSVAIVHDVNEGCDRGVGFMDVYVIPEPATLGLIVIGAAGLLRRRR